MVEKLLTNNHLWYYTTDGYWCLGIRHGDRLLNIIARIQRRADGSHDWQIADLPYLEGNEPSRAAAMQAIDRVFIDSLPENIIDIRDDFVDEEDE